MVSYQKCGYAFSRTSTVTSARKLHYYKCIGSDGWRKLGGPVCDNGRFVRQDLLDQVVWTEVIRLLEDPTLIQHELDRRLAAARAADPTKKREQGLQKEIIRVGKSVERILSAYQEGLVSLDQLRERMPPLRQREQALRDEARAIADQANDSAMFLRLAETLKDFLTRLRSSANTLDVMERQRIVRLVVKDVLIGDDTLVIRHCIPIVAPSPSGSSPSAAGSTGGTPYSQNCLLRKGSDRRTLRGPHLRVDPLSILQHSRAEQFLYQSQDPFVRNPVLDESGQPTVVDGVEEPTDVRIEHPVYLFSQNADRECIERLMRVAPRTEATGEAEEILFVDCIHHLRDCPLDNLVLQRSDTQWPLLAIWLWDVCSASWFYPVSSLSQLTMQLLEVSLKLLAILPLCHTVRPRRRVLLRSKVRAP